ncbi:MAG: hypothetical protein GDA40_00215 [Rhodobacteraceae bacterium]|nr:hypothetical protein [Paracoccaceae bacterium]
MNDLDAQAQQILRGNDQGTYTVPTHGLYPYQWNWDSALAAWGVATFDLGRAWDELDTLMASQWDTGMVPHIIFHRPCLEYFPGPEVWDTKQSPPSSGISQPPVATIIARLIWEQDPAIGRARLSQVYPALLRWHRWWHEARCMHGPAAVVHPWESGRDNAPDWDSGMAAVDGARVAPYVRRDTRHVLPHMRPTRKDYDRYIAMVEFGRGTGWKDRVITEQGPFLMADPAITFILLRAHEDLCAMGRGLGQDTSEIEQWADALRASLPFLWNDALGTYDARDLRSGAFANTISIGGFLAYLAGAAKPQLDAHLHRVWDAVQFGIPSTDPAHSAFDAQKYWRGPCWPMMNALLALGFRAAGRDDWAERLRRDTAALLAAHGFYEYFNPLDGTPCGGSNFTWTAAIWLAWARQGSETPMPQNDAKGATR